MICVYTMVLIKKIAHPMQPNCLHAVPRGATAIVNVL